MVRKLIDLDSHMIDVVYIYFLLQVMAKGKVSCAIDAVNRLDAKNNRVLLQYGNKLLLYVTM